MRFVWYFYILFLFSACASYGDRDVASTSEFALVAQNSAPTSKPGLKPNPVDVKQNSASVQKNSKLPNSGTPKLQTISQKHITENKLLNFVRSKYKNQNPVKVEIKKNLELKALDQTRSNKGIMYLAENGKFRLELMGPPKSIAIMNSSKGWLVDYPDPDFGGKLQVMVSNSPSLKKSQDIIRLILGEGELSKYFEQKSKSLKDNVAIYFFKTKTEDFDFTDLEIHIDIKTKEFFSIVYFDQLENKTSYMFLKTNFNTSVDDSLFNFDIPKDAEVTVIK